MGIGAEIAKIFTAERIRLNRINANLRRNIRATRISRKRRGFTRRGRTSTVFAGSESLGGKVILG